MVSGLQYKLSDPQAGMNRGRGHYYFRGMLKQPNGRRKATWSKYDEKRDGRTPHKRTPGTQNMRSIPEKERDQPHKADYKTLGPKGSRLPKKPRGNKGRTAPPVKGFF